MQIEKTQSQFMDLSIPAGWQFQTIEECCNILDSKRIPLNSEERNKIVGNIPYYGANGVQGYINKYIFDEHLVLLAEDGGYFNEYYNRPIAYYVRGKSWVNNHAHVLTSKPGYDLKWIFYSLVHKNILPWIKGTTRTKLNQSELRKIVISIPPLYEQHSIVSILSKVDELIQKTDQVIEQTQRLKKGLMQRLLTKGIGHTKFKKEYLALRSVTRELPISWRVVKLNKLCDVVRGSSPRPAGDPKYFGGEIPWITVSELTKDDNIFLNSATLGITRLGKENSRFLDKGTVVMANSGATLGKPKILNISGCINDGVAAFLNLDNDIMPKFLYYVLFSWIKILRSINQGVYQLNINTEIIGNLLFPLPSIEEQGSIVSILFCIDSEIQELAKYRSNLDVLKKGLMQKLLTGQIRVKL